MDKEGFNFDSEVGKYEPEEIVEGDPQGARPVDKIGENQFYDIVTSRKPDWQAIIYDLIHTEQLDPWDIDIVRLTDKYFEKIIELEEVGEVDFYSSSKVLLAASLLLRIKSEFLLNKHLKSIDEVLFGKKDEDKRVFERIEINEDELPILIPKTPLPRARRVTLHELMAALNNAMSTESRRIKREVAVKRAQKLSEVDFPKFRRIDLKDRIKQFYAKVLTSLKKKGITDEKHLNKIGFSNLVGKDREERLASFLPVLHLSNNRKLWLEQTGHLEEIWIYLHDYFNKNRDKFVEELEEDIAGMKEELAEMDEEGNNVSGGDVIEMKEEGAWSGEDNEGGLINNVENSVAGIVGTLKNEIAELDKEEQIDELTGFEDG